MTKLFRYFNKKEKTFAALAVVAVFVQVWLSLKIPDYMTQVTQLVEEKGSDMGQIWLNGGWMLLCAIGATIAAVMTAFFAAQIAAGLAKTVRQKVFVKTVDMSMQDVDHFSTASLVNRSTNDITQIQNAIAMGLNAILMSPIMAVWSICKIWGKAWQWTAITGGGVIVMILFIIISIKIVIPRFRAIQKLTDNINRIMREHLTGIRVIHAYNAEKYQENKFAKANDDITNNNLTAFRTISFMNPLIQFIENILTLGIYWIGTYLIAAASGLNKVNIFSNMVVFSQYAMMVVMSFMMFSMVFFILPRAQVSANRINEILETKSTIEDGKGAKTQEKGTIQFKDVSFTYPNAQNATLKDINFTAKQGETIAFIGATGSGKTTLLNLIPRFYDATSGAIYFDGENVKDFTRHDLRSRIGYATQKAILTAGTVRSNVAYGDKKISDDEIKAALDIAQAGDFVKSLDQKIDQGGNNLSGGQKQRISIARTIASRPEVMIFDDSFSALDFETDHQLRSELAEKTKTTTKIIVAQRITTIKDADTIYVLDHGKIVGAGKHHDLLKNCKVYQEIAASQLSKEELADA